MAEISLAKLFEFYVDTISRCTSEILRLTDQEIAYNLFEEFDVGVNTFMHDNTITKLRRAGLFDDEMAALSQEVRRHWLEMEPYSSTIAEIKARPEWQALFELCDRLKSMCKNR